MAQSEFSIIVSHGLKSLALALLATAMFFFALAPTTTFAAGGGGGGGGGDGGGGGNGNGAASFGGNAVIAARYREAVKRIDEKAYSAAIPILMTVIKQAPKHANAHNYLGYSYRKMGDFDASLKHYKAALSFDPTHRGAKEYLGELYLRLGDLAAAEKLLANLDSQCFFGCEEYDDLKEAVEEYKKANGG